MEQNTKVKDRVENVFRTVFNKPALVLEETLSAAKIPEWTSLQHVKLIAALEAEFNIRFEFSDLLAMETAGDMIRIIAKKLHEVQGN